MRALGRLTITNFRSIRAFDESLSDLTVMTGANNTGKSNLLAALHLYFRGETAPGSPFSFSNDYPKFLEKANQRKQTRIGVSFDLPANFAFRQRLEDSEKLLGRSFTLTKVWSTAAPTPDVFLSSGTGERLLSGDDLRRANQFLDLIQVRWVPNRVSPLDVLAAQESTLNAFIARAVGPKSGKTVFDKLQKVADSLGTSIGAAFTGLATSVDKVTLDAPTSVRELALALRYSISHGSVRLAERQQGSGIQSYLMFAVMRAADRADMGNSFGWKQMSLWLVEEPETSLHADLEIKMAALLREVALAPNGRQQIICTSHSQVVAENATDCYLLRFDGPDSRTGTVAKSLSEDQRVTELASAGIARFVVPFLRHPLDAIVLVEGESDYRIVSRAWLLLHGGMSRVRIVPVSQLGGRGTGGVAMMRKLLEDNQEHLKLRSRSAPIIALIDWEEKQGDLIDLDKAAKVHPTSGALRFEEKDANPQLDDAVKGIERFLPTAYVKSRETRLKRGGLLVTPSGQYTYAKSDVDGTDFKQLVSKDFARATPSDCTFLKPTLDRLAAQIASAR